MINEVLFFNNTIWILKSILKSMIDRNEEIFTKYHSIFYTVVQ